MFHHGSKISVAMLLIVFSSFALFGCGNSENNASDDATEQSETQSDNTANTGDSETISAEDITITIRSPADGDTVEGGTIRVVGKAEGSPNPGTDRVHMELTTDDDIKLGEDTALIADLDNEFSANMQYDLTDNMEKEEDGSVKATLKVYLENEEIGDSTAETILIKVK